MNFTIKEFAHAVVATAKCLTQGLEDSNLNPQAGQDGGTGQSPLPLGLWQSHPLLPAFVREWGTAAQWPGLSRGHFESRIS